MKCWTCHRKISENSEELFCSNNCNRAYNVTESPSEAIRLLHYWKRAGLLCLDPSRGVFVRANGPNLHRVSGQN